MQVTNPPLDSTRESVVMSLESLAGPEGDLTTTTEEQCHKLRLRSPILQAVQFAALKSMDEWQYVELDAMFPLTDGPAGLEKAIDRVRDDARCAFLVAQHRAVLI